MNIIILSAACCYPGMAAFDEQARKIIEQAAKETGTKAEIKVLTATAAIYGGMVPKNVMANLMGKLSKLNQDETSRTPAILINGEVVSYGVPQLENIKKILKDEQDKQR
jgi:hypothetical protein